jgi:hypothetical protein
MYPLFWVEKAGLPGTGRVLTCACRCLSAAIFNSQNPAETGKKHIMNILHCQIIKYYIFKIDLPPGF